MAVGHLRLNLIGTSTIIWSRWLHGCAVDISAENLKTKYEELAHTALYIDRVYISLHRPLGETITSVHLTLLSMSESSARDTSFGLTAETSTWWCFSATDEARRTM